MKMNSRDFVFVTGKAFTGKTHFIRAHIDAIPPSRPVYIYDFTYEYGDLVKKKNVAVYQVMTGSPREIEEFAGHVYDRGNNTTILSESDNYLQSTAPILLALVTTGRNRGINVIVDAKRPMSVRPAWRGRFNRLIMFQTTLPDDIEYLEEWAGTGPGSLAKLRELKQGEFIEFNLDTQEMSEIKRL